MTIAVPCISANPFNQSAATKYVDVFAHASRLDFIVPRTRTKFGDRVFSAAGPTVWNSLPESVRSAEALASFKRNLKTYRPICSTFRFNWLLLFINIVMPIAVPFSLQAVGTPLN